MLYIGRKGNSLEGWSCRVEADMHIIGVTYTIYSCNI